jgi:hypothetical protein
MRKATGMEWEEHEDGFLARSKHGFFYIYEESQRWYVEYELGAQEYGSEESFPLNVLGFTSPEEAKNAAEEYSQDIEDDPSDSDSPENE